MTWHDITDITCVLGNQTFLLVNKLLCGPVDLNIGQLSQCVLCWIPGSPTSVFLQMTFGFS